MTLGDRVVVMAGGVVQQAGPPLEVYRSPSNRFVASFIGMPPMNFLEGTVRANGGVGAVFMFGAEGNGMGGIALGSRVGAAAAGHAGRPLVLGIRPQALRIAENGENGSLPARIDVTEPLGDQVDLFCTLDGLGPILVRVPATRSYSAGERVSLALDAERAHVFEPGEFGANLTAGAGV
jgi:multiple sugar transport system ATP-binding protein